ncbi:MAG TPA: glycosyltransferase family 2 protein [Vicinamibacterales bacterium]|jgi:glycosyltransferase involved in cell wall biosynthesis|nr:glycosyltransferase family 2 protein [Vicinamibacterales bacterium]
MNTISFAETAARIRLERAAAHHVAADVSVIIAAKQEAPSIGGVIDRARHYASAIHVVVGRSTDGTADIAAAAGVEVLADGGRGKGEAIRRAIPHVRTPVTVLLDADGSHDPEDIPLLVEPILAGEADHVAASRLRGGSSELHGGFDEFLRLAGSSFITACINRRFGCQLSDSQNGFRAVRTSVLRQLNLRENTTTIEQEMTIKTLRGGWRIAEVPSHEHRRAHGTSHIRVLRDAPRYGYSLVKYLFF